MSSGEAPLGMGSILSNLCGGIKRDDRVLGKTFLLDIKHNLETPKDS
jgi:hypothetical protein